VCVFWNGKGCLFWNGEEEAHRPRGGAYANFLRIVKLTGNGAADGVSLSLLSSGTSRKGEQTQGKVSQDFTLMLICNNSINKSFSTLLT